MADFNLLRFMDRAEWVKDANCLGVNSEVFFPARGENTGLAKSICRACGVQAECLAYALNNGEHHGIWGGMSESDRRRIQRTRAVNATGPIPPPANCSVMSTAATTATSATATSGPSPAPSAARLTLLPISTASNGA